MGQKIHPIGFRVGIIRGFDSHWYYGKKGYGPALLLDHRIRNFIKRRTGKGNVSRVEIADLVTDMTKVKHPMDAGQKGQKGIEW